MKVSYKVLKKYIPHIGTPEEVAQDLIMHTAEVDEIHSQKADFENIVYGKITSVTAHPDADSLRVCMVDIWESEDTQIVCGGSNLEVGQAVAVAKIGASVLWHGQGEPVVMKKTAIRGVDSYGMICASEEIKLKDEFPATSETEILDLSHIDAKTGTNLAEVLGKDDVILEIDNKAINHRPDLFSHIGIAREIAAINGEKLPYDLTEKDFSYLKDLEIQNHIPQIVKRYLGIKVSGVSNIASPDYVLDVLKSHDIDSKGLLVDITNYSLYLYGQPTHCFDADKITGNIHIRFAQDGENFVALNDKQYTLTSSDIVIADDAGVIALGGVIGGKDSAVSETTKNIIIESAWFEQGVIRHTGKRLGLRTDALNVFEKDLVHSLSHIGASLIIKELEEHFENIKLEAISDIYPEPSFQTQIDFNLDFICNLIGKNYSKEQVLTILHNVWIHEESGILMIPLWRKDISHIADLAEEVARLDGYDKVKSTVPRINLWAISQSPIYKAKRESRNYLVACGYFELYTYSFVDTILMQKVLGNTDNLVPMKNALSEELTHLRGSLIPNLLKALEENKRDFNNMKLFECEKVFIRENTDAVTEHYELSWVEHISWDTAYYQVQNTLSDLLKKLWILKYEFKTATTTPSYAHSTRTADIVVRGKSVWHIWEIHPKAVKNFSLTGRVWFYSLNMQLLEQAFYGLVKANEVSSFQANSFDINFVVDLSTSWSTIQTAIEKSDTLITKVELFDIYEDAEKLPWKRSLSFTVTTQSLEKTLDDTFKNELIKTIVKNVEKKGWILR